MKHEAAESVRSRPFPWYCPKCRQAAVYPERMLFQTEVRHDGRTYPLEIPDLEVPRCRSCGKEVISHAVDDAVLRALRSHLHLLTPQQIRERREALGLSGTKLAECLGVAQETISRWETAALIQSRAMDNLLRVYFAFPEVRAALRGPGQDPNLGLDGGERPPTQGSSREERMTNNQPERDLERTHAAIFALQAEMKADQELRALCEKHGLPWDFAGGYEPRWFNGPPPEQTKVLFLMAEPGAITPTEAMNLGPAINHEDWLGTYNLRLQEHYWRANLRELCRHIWPVHTERNMYEHLGGSCTFWMSLPRGSQTKSIPAQLLNFFLTKYLRRFLALFPQAVILAAGGGGASVREVFGAHEAGVEQASG